MKQRLVLALVLSVLGGFMVIFVIVTQLMQIHELRRSNVELTNHNRIHERDLKDIYASMAVRNRFLSLISQKVGIPKKDVDAVLKNE